MGYRITRPLESMPLEHQTTDTPTETALELLIADLHALNQTYQAILCAEEVSAEVQQVNTLHAQWRATLEQSELPASTILLLINLLRDHARTFQKIVEPEPESRERPLTRQ